MLILTRRKQQVFYIGDDITVTVLEVDHRRQRCRLGIDAPKEIPIFRTELLEHTEANEEKARD